MVLTPGEVEEEGGKVVGRLPGRCGGARDVGRETVRSTSGGGARCVTGGKVPEVATLPLPYLLVIASAVASLLLTQPSLCPTSSAHPD